MADAILAWGDADVDDATRYEYAQRLRDLRDLADELRRIRDAK